MTALVNLYVLPAAGAPAGVAALARALLDGGFVVLPAVACAPLRERPAVPGLRTPQGAALLDPARRREVATPARLEAELARAAGEPVLLAFSGLGAGLAGAALAHDCAVGLYAFPGGHRLTVAGESGDGVLADETVQAWLHLQGEGAPGRAAFQASAAGRAVLAAWPGARDFQVDWT